MIELMTWQFALLLGAAFIVGVVTPIVGALLLFWIDDSEFLQAWRTSRRLD